MKQKGFTLVELMMVIAVLLILSVMIAPRLPEATAIIIIKSILYGLLGGAIGSIAYMSYVVMKSKRKYRRQLETPGEYMDRVAKKAAKQKASKLSKDLLQYVIKQIKRIWDSIIDAFFRETPPPKQGGDL